MRTRLLGRTGMLVSEFGLGTMTFGREADEAAAEAMLDHFVERGGTLVDTADAYQAGASEEMIGRWLERRSGVRDQIVLATKVRWRMNGTSNGLGLSRRWIVRACEDSLRRLRTDHIDLYQAHMWDPATPLEETLAAFDHLVRSGKVLYVGISNFTGWQLQRAILMAKNAGLATPVSLQPQYSLLVREIEWELVPLCLEEGIGIIPWGPLGQGWLSGKYRRGMPPEGATRLGENPEATDWAEAYQRRDTDRTWRVVETVCDVAGELGCRPTQVALRWLADRPGVVAPIVGGRTVEQLSENLDAGGIELNDEQRERLDVVSRPDTPFYPYHLIDVGTEDRRYQR